MKKILLCSLKYDLNFGDPIINECCKKLVEDILQNNKLKEWQIEEIDLSGKKSYEEMYNINKNIKYYCLRLMGKIIGLTKKICKKIKLKNVSDFLEMKQWYFSKENMIMKQYYVEKIKESDAIIFAGGGMIKYKYQNCYHYINEVTKVAEETDIPVYLNAVGVEGYDDTNVKCKLLKKALNRKCIKMITTRDDLEKLKKYVSNEITIGKVSDCAVYSNIVYNKEKKEDSKYIGLGVCRGDLFLNNNINYTEEQLLIFWNEIIEELKKEDIPYIIYTNGLKADNEFANKICEKYGYDKEKLILPSSPNELVEAISSFKGAIATRLHSCIIAYSLEVPIIGLVWNRKLKMFGESIQYPERFFEVENFDAKNIVKQLKEAIGEGYTNIKPEDYRKNVKGALEKFITEYCK